MSDKKEISETLKAAKLYLSHLRNLNNKIQSAEQQIYDSSKNTEKVMESIFENLISHLTQTLITRKSDLIRKIQEVSYKKQLLKTPLDICRLNDKV